MNGFTFKRTISGSSAEGLPFGRSIDLSLNSDVDDSAILAAYINRENVVLDSPLTSYLGPGLVLGTHKGEIFWGPSAVLGVYFTKGPYEVFLQIMPRLSVMPDLDGRFDSATGLRLRF